MDSEEPPTKRQRQDTADPVVPIRAEPWFDDGTIVLQPMATQFRVYRGTLTANSSVFRDLFAVTQPLEGEELVEGCNVVHLSDSAEDWGHVLKALYEYR
jgi:hypothetical protein